MKMKVVGLARSAEISRWLAHVVSLSFLLGLPGCVSQAVAKDGTMTPHHIPLRFHDLIGQLAAEMPTSLERVQSLLDIKVQQENDDGFWQTYQPRNLVTSDGIPIASIILDVRKPALSSELRLQRIIVTFDPATCIPMSKVRQEFGMTEYFPWPSSHRLAETYYNPNFSYRFMVTDSRIRANFETEGAECVGEIDINTSDPTKL